MESLESRNLLSVTLPPGIASVVPSDGSVLTQTPQNLVITFDQPFIAYNASFLDVQIYPVVEGVAQLSSPIFGSATVPVPAEIADPPGASPDGTVLEVPLSAQDLTLPGGTYQINIVGGSGLEAALSFPDVAPWSSGNDVPLAQFTLPDTGGVTLSQPTANLGTIGSTVREVGGVLDSHAAASAVDLYQISLAAGHSWQLGLSVSEQSIGSPLLTALTLLDAEGNVIATSTTGLPSEPDDPYLFSGLSAGTYYVAVSASTNLPYSTDGYNPLTGTQGLAGLNQSGGPFQLDMLALPHDQPTQLVSFSLDHADPLGSSPTGLTLTFSSPLNLTDLFQPDSQQTALEVVDSSGGIWPTTIVQYQVSDASLTLVFDEPLPQGQYTLIVPPRGGLADLAGHAVTAPGEPPGVLATWTVAPGTGSSVQNNLGVLWPSTARLIWPNDGNAFSQTTVIAPDSDVTYRWVVTVPGIFVLQTQKSSGILAIQNSGNSGTTILDPGSTLPLNTYPTDLGDGVYELRFTNLGSRPASVSWLLEYGSLDWEKIVDNGVGQGSALSLMMFSPASASSVTNPASAPSVQAISPLSSSTVVAVSTGAVPPTLLVTVNAIPLGQPTLDAGPIPPASSGQSGPVAAVNRSPGVISGIGTGAVIAIIQGNGVMDPSVTIGPAVASAVLNDATAPTSSVGVELGSNPEADRARADLRALAGDDWLVAVVSKVKSNLARLVGLSESDVNTAHGEPSGARELIGREPPSKPYDPADPDLDQRSRYVVKADIESAVGLIVLVAVIRRFWRPLREKLAGRHRSALGMQPPARLSCPAPHALAGYGSRTRSRTVRLLRQ